MKLYLDTSLLVSALSNEWSTSQVLDWIESNKDFGFATSRWSVTEFSSALAMKVRTGHLDHDQRLATLRQFRTLIASFDLLAVEAVDFDTAAKIADREQVALRSGDALHLAIAMRLDLPLRTLDRRFVQGAAAMECDISLVATQ